MTGFLRGAATAMITPFTEDGVDFESFEEMINYQLAGGIDGLVVLGTTGEPATMSETEREETIRKAVSVNAGRAKLIVGVGSNCTKHAIASAQRAEALGADGLLAVTPYYNKCTQAGAYAYYRAIAESVNIPVIAYNVPSRTGFNLLPETAERLCSIPNMAGIKEASGNMAQAVETMRRIRGKMDLYSGEDALNLPLLCIGGTAVISVVSNLAPKTVKELTMSALSLRLYTANKLSDRLLPLVQACFAEVNPIPAKEGMNLLGFRAGEPRAPLTPLTQAHRAQLITAMKACGLEVKA